jgi:hypothetical protein
VVEEVEGVEQVIRRAAAAALVSYITMHHIQSLQEHIPSQWVQEGRVAWGAVQAAELQLMAAILFLDPSTVMEVVVEDPLGVWIMEVRGGRVAALHVVRPVARP